MQAGRLTDTIIHIKRTPDGRDAFGAVIPGESVERKIRANVTHLNGTLGENAGELFESVTCKVEVHHYQNIAVADQLMIRGELYDVISVDSKPALRRLTIQARRVNV